MVRMQQAIYHGNTFDGKELRRMALQYQQLCGGTLPPDTTRLPQWWEQYPKDYLERDTAPISVPERRWNASTYFLSVSGRELGLPVRNLRFLNRKAANKRAAGCTRRRKSRSLHSQSTGD